MLPSIFGENLLDNFFDDAFDSRFFRRPEHYFGKAAGGLMKTDVKESDEGYELSIDLPGYKKEDVKVSAENGYLTITAARNEEKGDKDEKGKYIRRERYTGSCTRSFYIGEDVQPEQIGAKFEDGILKLDIPKVQSKLPEEKVKYIDIQ